MLTLNWAQTCSLLRSSQIPTVTLSSPCCRWPDATSKIKTATSIRPQVGYCYLAQYGAQWRSSDVIRWDHFPPEVAKVANKGGDVTDVGIQKPNPCTGLGAVDLLALLVGVGSGRMLSPLPNCGLEVYMKTRLLGLIACMALLGVSLGPAFADTVFDVVGTFSDPPPYDFHGLSGYGLSGTITIDTTLGTVTDLNLTVTGYAGPQNSFIGVPETIFATDPSYDEIQIVFLNPSISELVLEFQTSTTPGSLVGFAGSSIDFGEFYDFSANVIAASELSGTISATPLPAALPLFATGLGAIGLFGWRRRRKRAAAIAAT